MDKKCIIMKLGMAYELNHFPFFSIGKNQDYFNQEKAKKEVVKNTDRLYLPVNKALFDIISKNKGKIKVNFSINGKMFELWEKHNPEMIETFISLAKTGNVEFLSKTYYASNSAMFSETEFNDQVMLHNHKIFCLFGETPEIFFNEDFPAIKPIKALSSSENVKGIISFVGTEDSNEGEISYTLKNNPKFNVLFTENNSTSQSNTSFEVMDYSSFKDMSKKEIEEKLFEKKPEKGFESATEAFKRKFKGSNNLSIDKNDNQTSSLSRLQNDAVRRLYMLETHIKATNDVKLIDDWRILQSNNFLEKIGFDPGRGEECPYENYMNFMNIINDISLRIKTINNQSEVCLDYPHLMNMIK